MQVNVRLVSEVTLLVIHTMQNNGRSHQTLLSQRVQCRLHRYFRE